jgi:hypothetical protein
MKSRQEFTNGAAGAPTTWTLQTSRDRSARRSYAFSTGSASSTHASDLGNTQALETPSESNRDDDKDEGNRQLFHEAHWPRFYRSTQWSCQEQRQPGTKAIEKLLPMSLMGSADVLRLGLMSAYGRSADRDAGRGKLAFLTHSNRTAHGSPQIERPDGPADAECV